MHAIWRAPTWLNDGRRGGGGGGLGWFPPLRGCSKAFLDKNLPVLHDEVAIMGRLWTIGGDRGRFLSQKGCKNAHKNTQQRSLSKHKEGGTHEWMAQKRETCSIIFLEGI